MAVDRNVLWELGQDESVQVNQRALIDKVLARYSGEFTVFRELLQNSDDAGSTRVEIHFKTSEAEGTGSRGRPTSATDEGGASLSTKVEGMGEGDVPDFNTTIVKRWVFKNDGMHFREEDWNRLKKIAEGNPDEDKIGAFGVGFYSLFSVTEEPFVTSGDSWMGFYWKGDQLVARKGLLGSSSSTSTSAAVTPNPTASPTPSSTPIPPSPWTTFDLPLRSSSQAPLPKPFDFLQFLCSSLTFMTKLKEVEVWLDDWRIGRVEKSAAKKRRMEMGALKGLKGGTPMGLMNVDGIESVALNIQATVLSAVYLAGSEKPKPKAKSPSSGTSGSEPSLPGGFSFGSGSGGGKSSQRAFFSSIFSSFTGSSSSSSHNPSSNNPFTSTPITPVIPEKKPPNLKELIKSTISLTIYSVHADVSFDRYGGSVAGGKKLVEELVRSTKKNPPKRVVVSLIYTGKDAYDASKKEDEQHAFGMGSLFQGLRADLDGVGSAKIFIGHATGQTTGVGGHMAARFIPTVERESIDLVDKNVAVWNKELLAVGGYLCRAIYTYELEDVKMLWMGSLPPGSSNSNSIDSELRKWLQDRSEHTMKFFSFRLSTPSGVVSSLLETAFYACSKNPSEISLISTQGIKDAGQIRLYDKAFAAFMKELPLIPESIQSGSGGSAPPEMVSTLRARGMLRPIVLTDVFDEMRKRPFGEAEMVACLKWWFGLDTSGYQNLQTELRRQFLDAAILTVHESGTGSERVIPLSFIATYISQQNGGSTGIIPIDGSFPLPPDTFPYSISRQLSDPKLLTQFFTWTPLDLAKWLQYYLSTRYSSRGGIDADEASKVLYILARSWGNLDSGLKLAIKNMLAEATIVPTRMGLQVPEKAYFASVDIFSDLPVVSLSGGGVGKGLPKGMEQMLEYLGVRKHVELQLIFTRMYRTGDWSAADLVKYLATIRKELTSEEMARLGQTRAFVAEVPQSSQANTPISPKVANGAPNTSAANITKYIASELFEPTDANRTLGLPILAWSHTKWRSNSPEAAFLFEIGLQKHPNLQAVIHMASTLNQKAEERPRAWKFLLDHYDSTYTTAALPTNIASIEFVPAKEAGGTMFLAKPSQVFTDPKVVLFGFNTTQGEIPQGICHRFSIAKQPKTENIVNLFKTNPPRDVHQANTWFEALATRIPDFTESQKMTLQHLAFVPKKVTLARGNDVTLYRPTQCYLKFDASAKFHSKLFVFVDFSDKAAHFLRMCGVRDAPSTQEVAQILVNNPQEFLTLAGSRESFLSEIRNLAVNSSRIDRSILSQMDKKPCLLGLRRSQAKASGKSIFRKEDLDDLEDDWHYTHELALPKQIVIVDDTSSYNLFAELLLSVPQEDLLEEFYAARGSPRISELVQQKYNPVGVIQNQGQTEELRTRVLTRLSLFLHEHGHHRAAVEYSWMETSGNFVVQVAQRIHLTKQLRFHSVNSSKTLDASAAVTRASRNGPITLWISGEVDMYEVANALLSVILRNHKVNDALLFSTILSTDLRSLRRRGYNVDRILRQQRRQKEAAAEAQKKAADKEEDALLSSSSEKAIAPPPPHPAVAGVNAPPPPYGKDTQHRGLLGNIRKLVKKDSVSDAKPPLSPPPLPPRPPGVSIPASSSTPPMMIANPHPTPRERQANGDVTSHAGIERNVQQAINACKGTNSSLLRNRQQMSMVKESLDDGYCDISGLPRDLAQIGSVNSLPIYLSPDVENKDIFIDRFSPSIHRFTNLLLHLSGVYDVPKGSMHLFYDVTGGTIAFNRNASIFFNLRYFIAWHDEQVGRGELANAYISWYFTFAHEIAHNLVQPHNSEHEFYFSSICERYLEKLYQLISTNAPTTS